MGGTAVLTYLNSLKESHGEDLHQLRLVNPERGRVGEKKKSHPDIYIAKLEKSVCVQKQDSAVH